ncbi:MAG TPA: exopolysaccharide biosynthesis polyprenyl glycosylphosphotransferase [Gaiellaceae bacterium]|nr:exopolysaccharide biosynthesis polyprenyl glycosylphosphotransferase [Gaiellaceae bacterium]
MSAQLQEHVEPLEIIGEARPLHISRRTAASLATAGRFGVVWLTAYAFLSGRAPSLASAALLATGLAVVWFFALTKSFDTARLTLLSLGPAVAAALGTVTGVILVSALSVWVNVHLPAVELAEVAGGILVFSWAWEALVHRTLVGRRRLLVIGVENGGTKLVEDVRADVEAPFEVVALVGESHVGKIGSVVERYRPDIVVLTSHDLRPEAFEQLLDVARCGFKLVGLAEFYEHAFGRVPVESLRPAWFVNVLHLYQRPYPRVAKRAFDIAVALVALVAVSWLLPILWLVVRRTGGAGPVIFRQTRLGERGRRFTIYKFRTMRLDAEADGAVWASQDDPRITMVGRLMRKTRLDELPQLVNVLKGEMSVVGPRPERPEFLEQLRDTVPFWTRRHLVKPGITGWAQVRRGYTADAEGTADKLSYDLWYLRHRSLAIDLAVCVKTFTTIFTGSGAR